MAVPYFACMALVANIYHLPPRVLPAIQAVEGGQPGLVHKNTDGSEDLGVMQVNTRWLPAFAHLTGLSEDAVRSRLTNESCFSIAAAGAIMQLHLAQTRGNLMLAIGNYHSVTVHLNLNYRQRVVASAWRLFGG